VRLSKEKEQEREALEFILFFSPSAMTADMPANPDFPTSAKPLLGP
jgi:hypothetical protein